MVWPRQAGGRLAGKAASGGQSSPSSAAGERPFIARAAVPAAFVAVLALVAYSLNWELVRSLEPEVVWEYRVALLEGLLLTLLITAIATAFGLMLGTILAIMSQSPVAPLRWIVVAYVEVWRNTPLLVQLIWIHFALPILTGVTTTAFESGVLTMTLQSSAYFTEIVRAGIEAVPKGQWEAAHALGLPVRTRWGRIVLPQAGRLMIPPLANLGISYFKATAVLSILSISELMTVATRVSNVTFKPIEPLTAVAVIYFVLGYAMSRGTFRLERVLSAGRR
ncbi:MAG: amino acid ABC transporter permease [Alphaproteobacteria bacterium]